MALEAQSLEVFIFPFMAPGHMIPMLDLARLFASRGVTATVVTTPGNASLVQPAIDRANQSGYRMRLLLIPFPSAKAGLPEGCETATSVPPELRMNFFKSTALLRDPFEQLLRDHSPDCVVSDAFFPWTADVARDLGIPRLVFLGTSFFSACVLYSLYWQAPPTERLPEGEESFVVPGLPHRIELLRTQTPDSRAMPDFQDMVNKILESELKSLGMVVNSFYELEPEYADHYRNVLGRRAWHVGPVSLCNQEATEKATRGDEAAIDCSDCLRWLDGKEPNSVVYVCFGSISMFTSGQLREIALALEASGHPFIWVVRKSGSGAVHPSEWLPEGFLERIRESGRGLLVRGWAPQILILGHGAVGGFVTHCGWNSCLEAVSAGVPLVTWPLAAEQFYNERLITDVLGIGVRVGVRVWTRQEHERELIKADVIGEKVAQLMGGGEEADGMRPRARELARMARRAMEEGGSSHSDMDRLIDELTQLRLKKTDSTLQGK